MATERYALHPGVYGYMCDSYYDPRNCSVGGAKTCFDKIALRTQKYEADKCLECFNQQNKRNFVLVDIVKLNSLPRFLYMTFVAQEDETNETCYFRGVYKRFGQEVELCEIKEDGAAGLEVPDEHDDYFDYYSLEKELLKHLASPKEWGLLPPRGLEDEAATTDVNGGSPGHDPAEANPKPKSKSMNMNERRKDIDKQMRALKKKIRALKKKVLQQTNDEKDLKPEQLEKIAKLEGWRNELKLLKDTKANLVVPVS